MRKQYRYNREFKAILTGVIVYGLALVVSSTLLSCNKETYKPQEQCVSKKGLVTQYKIGGVWANYSIDTLGTTYCSDTTDWIYYNDIKRLGRKAI